VYFNHNATRTRRAAKLGKKIQKRHDNMYFLQLLLYICTKFRIL